MAKKRKKPYGMSNLLNCQKKQHPNFPRARVIKIKKECLIKKKFKFPHAQQQFSPVRRRKKIIFTLNIKNIFHQLN
jgi:hypothetical protein